MDALEQEAGVVSAEPVATWTLAEHVCRHCFSCVLVRTDDAGRAIARCSGCDLEAIGGPEAICACGSLPDNFRVKLRCVRNEHRTAETPAAIVVIEATADVAKVGPAGVSVMNIEGSARQFFRCEPYRATLSTTACADRWRLAQHVIGYDADRFEKCRDCRVGASMAGERHVHRSAIFNLGICPRCRRGGARMIGGRLDVSCWNREREVRVGKNGKGTKPTVVLEPRRLGVVLGYGDADQRHVEVGDDLTRDTVELALQVLATVSGRVAFCKPNGGRAISTIELAPERSPARGLIAHAVAKPGLRKSRQALPVDRMPNEHYDQPQPDISDGGAPLARDLAMGIAS
jgi:hypothetical protein